MQETMNAQLRVGFAGLGNPVMKGFSCMQRNREITTPHAEINGFACVHEMNEELLIHMLDSNDGRYIDVVETIVLESPEVLLRIHQRYAVVTTTGRRRRHQGLI